MTSKLDVGVETTERAGDGSELPEWKTPKFSEISIIEDTQSNFVSISDASTSPRSFP